MTDDTTVPALQPAPNTVLCEWANGQSHWVRKAVSLVLSSSRDLSVEEIDVVYDLALIENGLLHGPLLPVPPLGLEQRDEEGTESLLLVALDEVTNVNALVEGQRIEFDSSLTVLFGENASGKTGYARILKRVAATRTAEKQILPNVHQTPEGDRTPAAVIEYALGEESHTVEWNNELGIEPLDRMSVFDSPAVALHIDEDLGYVFTPAGLGLFSSVAQSIQGCQKRFGIEIDDSLEANRFTSSFDEGSEVYEIVETLGATTDLQVLRNLANLSEEDLTRLQTLEVEAAALKAGNERLLLAEARHLLKSAELLSDSCKPASRFDEIEYEEARTRLKGALEATESARQAIFDSDSPFGSPDDDWQGFIDSADRFLKHTGHPDYPSDINVCPYCRQPRGEDAIDLLSKYRQFLDDALRKAVAESEKAVDTAGPQLDPIAVAKARASIEGLDVARASDEWIVVGVAFLTEAEAALADLSSRSGVSGGLRETASKALEDLSQVIDGFEKRIEELELVAEHQAEAVGLRENELRDLQARKTLRSLFPHITEHVLKAERRAKLQMLNSAIPNVLRSLTRASNSVSEAIQNRSFDVLFEEECAKLDTPPVTVEYQGRLGEAQRHKVVANHQPSAILCDGEQNVLALADFLAECRMRNVSTPIIFDDPVSSLDYRRSKLVAKRLVELSETHQVIIFTHNVLFISDLLSLRNRTDERITYYEIRNDGYRIGVVSSDVEPRLDHPNRIARKIDSLVSDAKAAEGSAQDRLINEAVDLVRKWLAAFVEQILFNNVIQRFRSNIRLGSIHKIRIEGLREAILEVAEAFEKCSQYTEAHSQGG